MTADEWIAFIERLPKNVQSCSFNATTGECSVTLAPVPIADTGLRRTTDATHTCEYAGCTIKIPTPGPRMCREHEEPRKVRDTQMIGRTAPVFGVEE